MAMLLKLQESANYIESPERDGCLDPTLQATFWCPLSVKLWSYYVWPNKMLQTRCVATCSVSSYHANCKERTNRRPMDDGLSLLCSHRFGWTNFCHCKQWFSCQVKNCLFWPWDQMGSRYICRCMVTIIVWCKILLISYWSWPTLFDNGYHNFYCFRWCWLHFFSPFVCVQSGFLFQCD